MTITTAGIVADSTVDPRTLKASAILAGTDFTLRHYDPLRQRTILKATLPQLISLEFKMELGSTPLVDAICSTHLEKLCQIIYRQGPTRAAIDSNGDVAVFCPHCPLAFTEEYSILRFSNDSYECNIRAFARVSEDTVNMLRLVLTPQISSVMELELTALQIAEECQTVGNNWQTVQENAEKELVS